MLKRRDLKVEFEERESGTGKDKIWGGACQLKCKGSTFPTSFHFYLNMPST